MTFENNKHLLFVPNDKFNRLPIDLFRKINDVSQLFDISVSSENLSASALNSELN
jgi:hypothetical protein